MSRSASFLVSAVGGVVAEAGPPLALIQDGWTVTADGAAALARGAERGDEARAFLRRLEGIRAPLWRNPYYVAHVHEGLGDTPAALEALDHALRERSPSMVRPLVDPTWSAATRAHPRSVELLRRVGMPEPLVREATVGVFANPTPALGDRP